MNGQQSIPAEPPAEVIRAVALAARIYDRLEAAGRRFHLFGDPVSGGLAMGWQDQTGRLVAIASGSELLEVATGQALPGHG
jgi:hypothetical protein